jgi:hypothetical protein
VKELKRKKEEGQRALSVVELWFAAADFPKRALGSDVVTEAKKV